MQINIDQTTREAMSKISEALVMLNAVVTASSNTINSLTEENNKLRNELTKLEPDHK